VQTLLAVAADRDATLAGLLKIAGIVGGIAIIVVAIRFMLGKKV
jgi:hypothetical protein